MRTYGTCTLSPQGDWIIEAEPHVMMRLRRVFSRIGQDYGSVTIKDTEEVCFDLRWFMERYPLQVDPFDYLDDCADAYEARMQTYHQVLSGKIEPRSFEMAIPPREYQQVAADLWLRVKGLLVADDVGLGKTCTAICGLTEPSTRPALVVTLAHLPKQWELELEAFAPELKTHIIRKGTPYDIVNFGRRGVKRRKGRQLSLLKDTDDPRFPDVLIINYHKLAGWCETLKGVVRTVIYDEIQELRRHESGKFRAATTISAEAEFRLGLSATPIYNYGGEIFNVMSALNPDALGTRAEFIKEWCYDMGGFGGQDKASIVDPQAFGRYMREQGLMIRRTRADVKRELPEVTKIPYHVDADPRALDEVADSVAALARIILQEDGKGFDKMRASEELSWRLRMATGVGKAPYVAEFVKLLLETEQKIVVFAWHREVYSILMDRLAEFQPRLYTGTESPARKLQAKQDFVEGDARVLLMSLRSGAGLDGLQKVTNTIVFAELDWSPGVHEQCEGRVARDGQENPVMAYYLVTDTGSDPVVSDALGLKRIQVEGLRTPDGELVEKLQTDPASIKKLAQDYLKQRGIR